MIKPIYGLCLRELIKFFRNRSRLLGGLAQPLMYLLVLGFGMDSVFRAAGYGNYSKFISPGVIGMTTIISAFLSGFSVLWDRKFGFLKETLISPSPRSAIVIGRSLGSASTSALQAAIVLAISYTATRTVPQPVNVLATIGAILMVGTTLGLLGMFLGTKIDDFQSIQLVINFALMPLIFLSGALFPLPKGGENVLLSTLVKFNPLSYLIDMIRWGMGTRTQFPASIDMLVCSALLVASFVLCLRSFRYVDVT